ncbi:MAG: envelope stress response membrane protein PspC [Acetobacteraceae bacterium]
MSGATDRFRIWRDTDHAWVAGVCAGLADYLGLAPGLVRALTVAGLIFFTLPTAVGYAIAAFVLKPKPRALFADPAQEAFWRGMRTDPAGTLETVTARLRALDARLARAERAVTASDFDLRQRFRDLGA